MAISGRLMILVYHDNLVADIDINIFLNDPSNTKTIIEK